MAVRANPNLTQRTLIVVGMALAIVAVMVVNQVWQTYEATIATARRDVQQFTQILEANTDITFQAVTLILDHAVETTLDRAADRPASGISERFVAIADNSVLVQSVALIDADGIIRSGAARQADGRLHALAAPVDASDKGIFGVHRDRTAPEARRFLIARPGKDLVSDARVIGISRSIYDEKGTFQGVCIVTLALDAFTRVYADLLPARYSTVELFRRDGFLLTSTNTARRRDLTESEKRVLKDMIPTAPAGVYRIASNGADSGDLLSYRAMQRYPIVIAVTANWFQFMARWWESTLVLVASAMIATLVIAGLTAWLVRRIAAEQRTKQALIENERRILESQRLSGIGYYENVVHAKDLVWSPNMFEIHGLDPATFNPSTDTYINIVLPEDQQKVIAAWKAFADEPRSGALECRIVRPNTDIRHIRYGWRVFEGEDGGPDRVFGVAQDVTAMRNAEDIIRDDEERLRDIVECSSDYIWELDAKGAVTLFSGAAITQFGTGAETGLNILTDLTADAEIADTAALQHGIQSHVKFRSLLVPIKNAEAETRWVRLSGNPRFDTLGRYLGYRGAGTDVTELYLRQERDEANRKAEALGRLASGMAHEINNLLQPIVIYANLGIAQTEPLLTIRQYFSRIGLAAERSMMIVKNVLAFARQSPPSRENVKVLELARETVDLIGGTLATGTVLEVNEDVDDLTVRVDRTGMAQLLTNLLTNAAEALPSGGRIGVTINAVNLAAESARTLGIASGVYCRLMVADNGRGIPADVLGKVFDPFFTTKSQGKGTGLWLSVVSGFAKSWGGTVSVESTPGVGTCFTVYVPVTERYLQAAQ